jgi:hypothetical protein
MALVCPSFLHGWYNSHTCWYVCNRCCRGLLVRAEKVIQDYFKDNIHLQTSSTIAHEVQFLLGVNNAKGEMPRPFQNGPNAAGESMVRVLPNALS